MKPPNGPADRGGARDGGSGRIRGELLLVDAEELHGRARRTPFSATWRTSRAVSSVTIAGGAVRDRGRRNGLVEGGEVAAEAAPAAGSIETVLSGDGSTKPKSNDAR